MGLSFVREGVFLAFSLFSAGVISQYFGLVGLTLILFGLGLFTLFFFRDPDVSVPQDEIIIVSPASGVVDEVGRVMSPDGVEANMASILLSIFDVHVTRSPITGAVEKIEYSKGKKIIAKSKRSMLENEQNTIKISGVKNVWVTQIAGIAARRIVCWVRPKQNVLKGGKLGMIRFGSRTNIIMPLDVEVLVSRGQRVSAGETPVGKTMVRGN
ncbi:MAG TPA: phosphatidylserine decarboxylase family protein [Candidatus Altiarchaeales archaeon]|nr:phosphatidylserine decarboxylase family protein [Candidatus Altiarchaeales archaeon]